MKKARSLICSKYRMAWLLVFFDLPVGTNEQRNAANRFRKDLLEDGYLRVQYSVYARPCGSADKVETHVRRLKPKLPAQGEVRSLIISDAQWGRMAIYRNTAPTDPESMPAQLLFF